MLQIGNAMGQEPKTVTILGATGSIGQQTLDVIAQYPQLFQIGYITVNRNIEMLQSLLHRFSPKGIVIRDVTAYTEFREKYSYNGVLLCGEEGLIEAASDPENTIVVAALVGFAGVKPTIAAIENGIPVALANKEVLVSAGCYVIQRARERQVPLLPIDSEHSAIAQCLRGEERETVEKIILTASGGPFRTYSQEQLQAVTPQMALRHPTWTMGAKITIDSATLMNKGLELIEARWLFDIPDDRIDILIHPQSIIHSLVQFIDGSVKAQLSIPDMRLPILYALTYPERLPTDFPRLSLEHLRTLTFEAPDPIRFPCLTLAREALRRGGTAPAILNAANEIAVYAFLSSQIRFTDIPVIIEETLQKIPLQSNPSLDDIFAADQQAREFAQQHIESLSKQVKM